MQKLNEIQEFIEEQHSSFEESKEAIYNIIFEIQKVKGTSPQLSKEKYELIKEVFKAQVEQDVSILTRDEVIVVTM